MYVVLIPIVLIGLSIVIARRGLVAPLLRRPITILAAGSAVGFLLNWAEINIGTSVPMAVASRFVLGMLVFTAALQCRLSRLPKVSGIATRLIAICFPLTVIVYWIAGIVIVPDTAFLSAMAVAMAVSLSGTPTPASALLTAPVDPRLVVSSRVEAGAMLPLVLPLIMTVIGIGLDPDPQRGFFGNAAVAAVMSFAAGGSLGLLAAWFFPLDSGDFPIAPLALALGAYALALIFGFEPVTMMAATGLLYAEEADLSAPVRTRLWRVTESVATPFILALFGLAAVPYAILGGGASVWILALIAFLVARRAARFFTLNTARLAAHERQFLTWYGGAPGHLTALVVTYMAVAGLGISDQALSFGVAVVVVGLVVGRLLDRILIRRLVQQTALAEKRRYGVAL
ncbi:hypothetical protein PB2503_00947 [Parvularcula bermudensis HTCC2503]|uniref:Cation/H+ exchanger domain-containing protein n=1 Tax=Parvularcula bermudensis (strain ATCC BAA-594 / HTCC2503 / KCTC 12087) TaxID=314260 RepID=E0TB66_PARBH|nr:hypothetical protein [Parvularcula bermudensis]ADM08270.1 hypothetical protein PB2503_00947 [Parvularcula bermudensis HTCC2503]